MIGTFHKVASCAFSTALSTGSHRAQIWRRTVGCLSEGADTSLWPLKRHPQYVNSESPDADKGKTACEMPDDKLVTHLGVTNESTGAAAILSACSTSCCKCSRAARSERPPTLSSAISRLTKRVTSCSKSKDGW